MTELNQDIVHVKGDSREVTITVVDEAGDPVDITDCSVRWRAVTYASGVSAPITKSTAAATISLVRVDGATDELDAFRFNILPADTISVDVGSFRHEAEVVDLLGNVSTTTKGFLHIKAHDIV